MKKIFLILALLLFVCTNSSAMMPMLSSRNEGIVFTSNFEFGNGTNFTESPANTINVVNEADPSPATASWGDRFYWKLTGVEGKSLTIKCDFDNDRDSGPYEAASVGYLRPFYSYDQSNWTVVSSASYASEVLTFSIPNSGNLTGNIVYVSDTIPYTYSDLQSDISTWTGTGNLSSEVLGASTDTNRSIYHLTAGSGPRKIIINARVHSKEPHGSWDLKGFLDWLTGGSDLSSEFLAAATFEIYPMANPAGVYDGYFFAVPSGDGSNPNRDYDTDGPNLTNEQKETYLVHTDIDDNHQDAVAAIDIHSSQAQYSLNVDQGDFDDSLESRTNYLFDVYGADTYFPDGDIQNWDNNTETVDTTLRSGLYQEYGLDVYLLEGGMYQTNYTGAWTSAQMQAAGAGILKSVTTAILRENSTSMDVATDGDIFGAYHFESGALTTDSSGESQTLTDNGTVDTDTTNYVIGSASADFDLSVPEYFSRTDSNLATGHPLKSSTGEHDFSITFWYRRAADLTNVNYVISKYVATSGQRQFAIVVDWNTGANTCATAHSFYTIQGYNGGDSYEDVFCAGYEMPQNQWYFVAFTYTASTNTHAMRIWGESEGQWITLADTTVNATADMYPGTAPLAIGSRGDGSADRSLDGNLDEVLIFDRVISDSDIEQIKNGVYGN